MRGGARRLAWLALSCCLALPIGGCYSSDYGRQTAATAAMLRDLAAKLDDYCRADFKTNGREISSEEMGEFYYGLKKARSYAAQTSAHSARQSYRDLLRLIDGYAQMVNDADRYRLSRRPDPGRLEEILARGRQVAVQAQAVLDDLAREK